MGTRQGYLKIKSLSAELFANFGSELYFEGFLMSVLPESSSSEEDNASKSDDEMQTYSLKR